MALEAGGRTIYGPNKYAALHLMLARWQRRSTASTGYQYVTLGGTELRDINSLAFIGDNILTGVTSYELLEERYAIATESVRRFDHGPFPVAVRQGDIFSFKRISDEPHLFYVDLEGICACTAADFPARFAEMFSSAVIKEGDALLITSYLGRHPGWPWVFKNYDAEFRILKISDPEMKKNWYRRVHPSFTLYRALLDTNLQGEIKLTCLGCIEYRDSSRMGIYGYTIESGITEFSSFIRRTPYFNVGDGTYELC